jgi:hypothetical protein
MHKTDLFLNFFKNVLPAGVFEIFSRATAFLRVRKALKYTSSQGINGLVDFVSPLLS